MLVILSWVGYWKLTIFQHQLIILYCRWVLHWKVSLHKTNYTLHGFYLFFFATGELKMLSIKLYSDDKITLEKVWLNLFQKRNCQNDSSRKTQRQDFSSSAVCPNLLLCHSKISEHFHVSSMKSIVEYCNIKWKYSVDKNINYFKYNIICINS